ncbi:HNH endonuclease [Mesorhizobium sp. RMAD-H1]|uniref:HNH endonuclease n=1 Tax=Mesorhizobium sp. RMAD-H1 TaxID=2587065 RepID=UPI0016150B03|nr:HNH endonuclease [Mesorhizobium sp. RMAD-H1]MBB2973959.1 5-methylcytosine-specific restriction endonuclease McrA [Mesorhizobium sp. RMAD-H1]
MGRLKMLKPRVGILAGRIGDSPANETARSRMRDAMQPWRAWYKTSRWQKLRERILIRDRYICQKTGVLLIGKYPAPDSPVVDHKTAHRGDEQLFWDEDNLHAVSKAYHDSTKQAEERRSAL